MNIGRIVQRPLVSVSSGTTMLDAAKLMVENNIGLLVICDAKNKSKLAGVISERDIIRTITAGGELKAPVDEVRSTSSP